MMDSLAAPLKARLAWKHLPVEVILEVVSHTIWSRHTTFSRNSITSLSGVDRRTRSIIINYENSIAREILAHQFPEARKHFPVLYSLHDQKMSYWFLETIAERYQIVEKLCAKMVDILGPWAALGRGDTRVKRWITTGWLLMWRLLDTEKYEDKIELLFSLPAISSATLFLALYFSLNAAIELGHGPIHKNFFRNPEETADARLVFEERLLNAGPEYLLKTLQHDHETAQDLWQHYTLLESAQMYDEEGNPPQKTLISQLRQSFAKSYGCNLHKSMTHILNMACSTDSMLYRLDEEGMGDVISGRVIERAAGKPEEGR